jgi:hypothetical protein
MRRPWGGQAGDIAGTGFFIRAIASLEPIRLDIEDGAVDPILRGPERALEEA